MKRILFVCLGNICRSPLAEGIARRVISQNGFSLQVDSAGTSSWHEGEAPCKNSIEVAARHGIDITSQRSRPVGTDDLKSFEYVVALDRQNLDDLKQKGFEHPYLLGDFGGYGGEDIPDPYYFSGFEGFEKVYGMIEACVEDLIIKVEHGSI